MDLKSINDEYLQFKKDLETIKKEKDAMTLYCDKIESYSFKRSWKAWKPTLTKSF